MKLQNDFLDALLKEMEIRKYYLGQNTVNTIYFGGGTPSLLSAREINRILSSINKHFKVSPTAEITFEANPDDITKERLTEWKNDGINRLSIGVQSFFEEDLAWMNRAHNADQATRCLDAALATGFTNMSIDLIFGTPTLSDEKWLSNLQQAVAKGIPHLSCYALTVEPGTALQVMIKKKKVASINTDDQARQFLLMTDFLQSAGYEHYEISNFGLPGKRSIHNSSYWRGDHYLGLGPSAHSFNGSSRQWNVANNALYIQSLNNNTVPFEIEILTPEQRLNEYIMTSIRTMEGTEVRILKSQFGDRFAEEITSTAHKFKERGWMQRVSDRLILTREGKLFADGIASELFVSA